MMHDRIFGEREKALEEVYFRDRDAKLLEKLRQKAHLDEIAIALGEKMQLDNPELLIKVRELGIRLDTAPAFFLAPLVQIAWADGKVSRQGRDTVLRLAGQRGIEENSAAHAQLKAWLRTRPSDAFFGTASEVLKFGYEVLPPAERAERVQGILNACQEVAEASAGIGRLLGLSAGVSETEASTLEGIRRALS
jgi:hypothetical protein